MTQWHHAGSTGIILWHLCFNGKAFFRFCSSITMCLPDHPQQLLTRVPRWDEQQIRSFRPFRMTTRGSSIWFRWFWEVLMLFFHLIIVQLLGRFMEARFQISKIIKHQICTYSKYHPVSQNTSRKSHSESLKEKKKLNWQGQNSFYHAFISVFTKLAVGGSVPQHLHVEVSSSKGTRQGAEFGLPNPDSRPAICPCYPSIPSSLHASPIKKTRKDTKQLNNLFFFPLQKREIVMFITSASDTTKGIHANLSRDLSLLHPVWFVAEDANMQLALNSASDHTLQTCTPHKLHFLQYQKVTCGSSKITTLSLLYSRISKGQTGACAQH